MVLLDAIMRPSKKIRFSRFPADLLSVLLLPGALVFYVVASYLPRYLRGTVFAVLGILFIVVAFHLARSSHRFERWLIAGVYVLMGIAMFYIAYVEAILSA